MITNTVTTELDFNPEKISAQLRAEIDRALLPLAIDIYNGVMQTETGVPIATGNLKASFDIIPSQDSKYVGYQVGTPLNTLSYASYVEFGCFFGQKRTKILTKHGWKRLNNVKVGDKVLTHKKRWKEVIQKHCYEVPFKIMRYTIKTLKDKITVTGNHPIYTDKGWKRADELINGDMAMVVHNDLPRFHWKNYYEHNLLKGKERAKRIIRICQNCGKTFTIIENKLKHRPAKYCSKGCYTRLGEQNPRYGKPFCHSEATKMEMKGRYKGQDNPMFKKHTTQFRDIGFRDDLGFRCKSTWEANYARILKLIGVEFLYESKTFSLSNGTSYTPDFYIISENKYVEIKGYMHDKSRIKLDLFKKEYPLINLELVDSKKYSELQKQYKNQIANWEESSSLTGNNLKFTLTPITEIKKSNYTNTKVYNLSVAEDESFIANHIVTHNTRPHYPPFEPIRRWVEETMKPDIKAVGIAYSGQHKRFLPSRRGTKRVTGNKRLKLYDQVARAIQWRIFRYGTKGKRFMMNTLQRLGLPYSVYFTNMDSGYSVDVTEYLKNNLSELNKN